MSGRTTQGFALALLLGGCAASAPRAVPEPVSETVAQAVVDAGAAPAAVPGDQDGDGVPDARDACVALWEDCDGFQDDDGCPELDNDADGIADACDRCPNDGEVYNGLEDDDGCPDRRHLADVTVDRIAIPERIYFTVGSPRGMRASTLVLDVLARTLNGNPGITLVGILGRAAPGERDPEGLSVRRAAWVRDELVRRGVGAARMEARGAGVSLCPSQGPRDPVSAADWSSAEFYVMRVEGGEALRWEGGCPRPVPVERPRFLVPRPRCPGSEGAVDVSPARPPPGGCAGAVRPGGVGGHRRQAPESPRMLGKVRVTAIPLPHFTRDARGSPPSGGVSPDSSPGSLLARSSRRGRCRPFAKCVRHSGGKAGDTPPEGGEPRASRVKCGRGIAVTRTSPCILRGESG